MLAWGGVAVLISSHLLAEVAQTADSVIIVNNGRLLADAPIGELTAGAAWKRPFLGLTAAGRPASAPERKARS